MNVHARDKYRSFKYQYVCTDDIHTMHTRLRLTASMEFVLIILLGLSHILSSYHMSTLRLITVWLAVTVWLCQ